MNGQIHWTSWQRARRVTVALLMGVVAMLAISACGGDDDDSGGSSNSSSSGAGLPANYKMGLNLALTGAQAPFDRPAYDGIKLAVDEINAKGGIDGKSKITLSVQDDRSDSAKAASASQTLASQGVNFMILPGDPSVAIPGGKVAQSKKIPMMTILASLPTQRQAIGDYFFAGDSSDNVVAAADAIYAYSHGMKTAYTLSGPDFAYTQNFPKYFGEAFEAEGGKVVGTDTFKSGTTDFSPQISKIRGLNPQPDVIHTAMYEPELPAFIKQLRAAGVKVPLFLTDASDTPATKGLGKLVDGTLFSTYGFPVPGSKLAGFYDKYQEHYGHAPPNVLPAIGYDSIYVIADAVKRANTTDSQAVVDAIDATKDYEGVLGSTTYGNGTTAGFPLRPIAVQKWVWNEQKGTLERKLEQLVTVPADKVPAG